MLECAGILSVRVTEAVVERHQAREGRRVFGGLEVAGDDRARELVAEPGVEVSVAVGGVVGQRVTGFHAADCGRGLYNVTDWLL